MSILIVGGKGSIGTRYQAVLRYLDKPFEIADAEHGIAQITDMARRSEGVIIATPTDTHADFIHALSPLRKPILCEKPVCKDLTELNRIIMRVTGDKTPLKMVFQYKYLDDPMSKGWSHYNYFRTGNDGLVWDCIQIIGLARGRIELENDSPMWRCILNGKALDLSSMEVAYIRMMRGWFKHPEQDLGMIRAIHEKTDEHNKTAKIAELF